MLAVLSLLPEMRVSPSGEMAREVMSSRWTVRV